jgi:hypothetical protein
MRQLAAGRAALDRALALGGRGAYVVQADIASLQTRERIDWPQVAEMYRRLVELTGSPVVELNRAVPVGQAGDPAAALRAVDRLDLDGYLYFHSTRGELLRRLGRHGEARAAYSRFQEAVNSGDAEMISKTIDEVVEPDVLFHPRAPIAATGAQALKQVQRPPTNRQIRRVQRDLHPPLRRRPNRRDLRGRRRVRPDATTRCYSGLAADDPAAPHRRPLLAGAERGAPRATGVALSGAYDRITTSDAERGGDVDDRVLAGDRLLGP